MPTILNRAVAAWLLVACLGGAGWPAAAMGGARLNDEAQSVTEVLTLVDERLALMPAVAAAKWPTHQPVTDPAREAAVIDAATSRARLLGLAPGPIEALFRLQIGLARQLQERLTARWQQDGYDYAGAAPNLARDIRPRLDSITERLLAALYVAAPTLSRTQSAAAAESLARAALPDERWTDADRHAVAQLLAGVRLSGPSTIDRARATGVLRIGTPADYAPFSTAQGDTVSGADIDLAGDLAAALGLKPLFVRTAWRTLSDDLAADRFDIAVGGISATPARLRTAAASVALSRSGKTAIGRCADRARYAQLAAIDSAGVTVIENAGGTNEGFARSHLAAARIVIHADNRTVFDEILASRADVMFTDETEVLLATHRHPQLCRLLAESYEPADKVFLYGRDGGWTEAVDPWLRSQVAAGVPARLLDQYAAQ